MEEACTSRTMKDTRRSLVNFLDLVRLYSQEQVEYLPILQTTSNHKPYDVRSDVLVEQLRNLGPNAHKWLHEMLNNCFIDNKISTIWRQSKIITILKSVKDSAIPKSYRPILLLCHTYKLFERMILNRIAPTIEQHLIKEQAGFMHKSIRRPASTY